MEKVSIRDLSIYSDYICIPLDLMWRLIQSAEAPYNRYVSIQGCISNLTDNPLKRSASEYEQILEQIATESSAGAGAEQLTKLSEQAVKSYTQLVQSVKDAQGRSYGEERAVLRLLEEQLVVAQDRVNHHKYGYWGTGSRKTTKAAPRSTILTYLALVMVLGRSGCSATVDYKVLSSLAGISVASVWRGLRDLKEHGYITYLKCPSVEHNHRRIYSISVNYDISKSAKEGGAGFIRLPSALVLELLRVKSVDVLRVSLAVIAAANETLYYQRRHGAEDQSMVGYLRDGFYTCDTKALRQVKLSPGKALSAVIADLNSAFEDSGALHVNVSPVLDGANDGRYEHLTVSIHNRLVPLQQEGGFGMNRRDMEIGATIRQAYNSFKNAVRSSVSFNTSLAAELLGVTSNGLEYTLSDSMVVAGRVAGEHFLLGSTVQVLNTHRDELNTAFEMQMNKNHPHKAEGAVKALGAAITAVAHTRRSALFNNISNFCF